MPKYIDIVGKKFNMLTVISRIPESDPKHIKFICQCDCGNIKKISGYHIKSGNIKSCGCLQKEIVRIMNTKHGLTSDKNRPKIWETWKSMRQRCYNKNHIGYKNYGGRGIKVCERWHKFENFFKDMGLPPTDKHCIERINNNKNYSPDNCKWATRKEQCNNTRRNHYIKFRGETKTLSQWCYALKLNYGTYKSRIKRGWSIKEALSH